MAAHYTVTTSFWSVKEQFLHAQKHADDNLMCKTAWTVKVLELIYQDVVAIL